MDAEEAPYGGKTVSDTRIDSALLKAQLYIDISHLSSFSHQLNIWLFLHILALIYNTMNIV